MTRSVFLPVILLLAVASPGGNAFGTPRGGAFPSEGGNAFPDVPANR